MGSKTIQNINDVEEIANAYEICPTGRKKCSSTIRKKHEGKDLELCELKIKIMEEARQV